MTVALTRHFENLRSLLACYSNIQNSLNCTIDLPTVSVTGATADWNSLLSLLATTQSVETSR